MGGARAIKRPFYEIDDYQPYIDFATKYLKWVASGPTVAQRSHIGGLKRASRALAAAASQKPPTPAAKAARKGPLPEKVAKMVLGFDGRNGGGGRRRPRKGNGFASRKIRTKKRLSKRKSKKRRNRNPRLMTSIMKNGVYRSEYTNGNNAADGNNALYIGHSDIVQRDIVLVFCYALIKNLFQRAGVEVASVNEPPRGIEVNDNITLFYKPSNATAINSFVITCTNVADSIATYGDSLYTYITGTPVRENQILLDRLIFTPALLATSTIPRVALMLRNMKVHLHTKSEMVFRNRTYDNVADTTTDDLDHVNIVGKWYAGKGTGTSYLLDRNSNIPMVASSANGVIFKASDATENSIIRPVDKRYLSAVSRSGAFKAPSGHTWTSKLSGNYVLTVDKFITTFQSDGLPNYVKMSVGNFKLYGLEKQIFVSPEPVRIASTTRTTVGVGLSFHKARMTTVTNV